MAVGVTAPKEPVLVPFKNLKSQSLFDRPPIALLAESLTTKCRSARVSRGDSRSRKVDRRLSGIHDSWRYYKRLCSADLNAINGESDARRCARHVAGIN